MKKKVAILVEDGYHVLELWYPYLYLRGEGVETVVIGTGGKHEYVSQNSFSAKSDVSIDEVNADDFSGVIIPGGASHHKLRESKEIVNFIKQLYKRGKVVGALCIGIWVAFSAGILKGKKVTVIPDIRGDIIIKGGAEVVDGSVVVDNNLITAAYVYALPEFCKKFLEKLT